MCIRDRSVTVHTVYLCSVTVLQCKWPLALLLLLNIYNSEWSQPFRCCFRCDMVLSSWAMDNRYLILSIDGSNNFDFSVYSESNEWMLVASSARQNIVIHQCGRTGHLEFNHLTYSMTIRRRVGFYVYSLIVPSVLLSFLMPLTFWISPTGDGRTTLGICLY